MIKWAGPFWDASGYASATRDYALALHRWGVPITIHARCFEPGPPKVGVGQDLGVLESLEDKEVDYSIVVSQLTPDIAVQYHEPGKYNINFFAWETTKVHPYWVECLNKADEVWVPSTWNVDVLKSSGVIKPVVCIPHIARVHKFDIDVEPMFQNLEGLFKFYSVFQWNERKNPLGLLRSYLAAFKASDPVVLVLKTYLSGGGDNEASVVATQVNQLKKDMGLPNYPKVVLVSNRLTDEQMIGLHKELDCCVSLSHAEGFGLPPFEAAQAGKPVISTGAGGVLEFLEEELCYLIPSQESLVKGMSSFNNWYLGTGVWYDPCEPRVIEAMQHVVKNYDEAVEKALKLRDNIAEKFSAKAIVARIMSRVSSIMKARGLE